MMSFATVLFMFRNLHFLLWNCESWGIEIVDL